MKQYGWISKSLCEVKTQRHSNHKEVKLSLFADDMMLNTENPKAFIKKKKNLCSVIERINIVKLSILPKAIYRFNAILIKISMAFFNRNKAKNPKIFMETLKTQIIKVILRKKNTRGVLLPDFKVYQKIVVVRAGWY